MSEPERQERSSWAMSAGQRRLFQLLALGGIALVANSLYLGAVRLLQAASGRLVENPVSLAMLLAHVLLGLLLVPVGAGFVWGHGRRAGRQRNPRAAGFGLGLFAALTGTTLTGVLLLRMEGFVELADPRLRGWVYGLHVGLPVLAFFLYRLHRRRGRGLNRGELRRWLVGVAVLTFGIVGWHLGYEWVQSQARVPEAEQRARFWPSRLRTVDGGVWKDEEILVERYCQDCHQDTHRAWSESVHRFSSFNNPAYRFSVLETRRVGLERDGDLRAARWCAGCHDPAPLLVGRFDDPHFDVDRDPTAHAGIGCLTCHATVEVGSVRGNADLLLERPRHYPFAFSKSAELRWMSRQLIRARPALHRQSFLKPLHRTPEFCSACHKVMIPPEVNAYRHLRGQNHYDSFRLSAASGHSASSFYYPEQAFLNCATCHMPLEPSEEFGARDFDGQGGRELHDHRFAAANTGLAALVHMGSDAVERREAFLRGSVRVDLFSLREGGEPTGQLLAPLRPELPELVPGRSYLVEVVVRNLRVGHAFTQGTVDSNEVWVEFEARSGDRLVGSSGSRNAAGEVDPWAHFLNAWIVNRHGQRIDRRNPQDIFATLYDHQIPAGAATVVTYLLELPQELQAPVELQVRVLYRKFDTRYLRYFTGDERRKNDLPVVEMAQDRVVLPVRGVPLPEGTLSVPSAIPTWERWYDYGIGLLLEGGSRARGALEEAARAFAEVQALGRVEGELGQLRVALAQGAVGPENLGQLERLRRSGVGPGWVIAWLEAQIRLRLGDLAEAEARLSALLSPPRGEALGRGFDFRKDDRLWELLGRVGFEKAATAENEGDRRKAQEEAVAAYQKVLSLDPEHPGAHYSLSRLYRALGFAKKAQEHLEAFERYRQDDPERAVAVGRARSQDPRANFHGEPWRVYPLHLPPELATRR